MIFNGIVSVTLPPIILIYGITVVSTIKPEVYGEFFTLMITVGIPALLLCYWGRSLKICMDKINENKTTA